MSLQTKMIKRRVRKVLRVREALKNLQRPRVSIFRTARHIYGQVIDDAVGKTLVSCSTLEVEPASGDKKSVAHAIGVELAKRCRQKGIMQVVFDRGPFLYHGRVKSFADGMRSEGLDF